MHMNKRAGIGFILQGIIISLVALGCASGENGKGGEGEESHEEKKEGWGRIALVDILTHDSAKAAAPEIIDAMLRQAFDSIPDVEYISFSEQFKVAPEGDSAVSVEKLVSGLNLDGLLAMRVARFGSVVGVDMRLIDPKTDNVLFQDRAFSFIRYRDEDHSLLFGPALYEGIDRLARRMNHQPDTEEFSVSAEPLVVGSVVIPRDPALGNIADERVKISKDGVRALGDFARFKFPQLVVVDYESRSKMYETLGLASVEDHVPVGNLERQALFNIDIPYYITASILPAPGDSVEFGVELRYVTGVSSDSLVDEERMRVEQLRFETATTDKDAISLLLSLAENVLIRHAARLEDDYALKIKEE